MTTVNLKPISLEALGLDAIGHPQYVVGFDCDGTVAEHRFLLDLHTRSVVRDPASDGVDDHDQTSFLIRSMLLFEEVTELMQSESEPIRGVLQGGEGATYQRKRMKPIAIRAEASELEHLHPCQIKVTCEGTDVWYRFVVEHSGIIGVKPESKFSRDMASNLTPAIPLLQSIIAFFEASQSVANAE